MRLATANTYDNALQNIYTRQSDLAGLQEKLTSGKNVNRPSDDPTGAAQAERALTRISRVATEQRALGAQSSAITLAESTLGDASSLLQGVRELVVSAGNGGYSATDRTSVAQQMQSLRDQLFTLANRSDSNGIPLFGGLGSTSTPFTDTAGVVTFNGIAGQRTSTDVAVPGAMDGQAVWMNVRSGNGTFNVSLGSAAPPTTNTGTLSTDTGQVIGPALVTGHSYQVTFSVAAGVTTYGVTDTNTGAVTVPVPPATAPTYVAGQAIQFDGVSFVANGAPANGDVVQLSPSTQTNVFKVLDDAIAGLKSASTSSNVSQTVALALSQIDASMNRIQSARGQAGEWLNRADNISSAQTGRTTQLTADQSRAEDLDMVKGISDFQNQQTGYQAALQSYAMVQKLSLFNYIS
jgi:flagellar hook-associated protein 3 FlgL